MTCPLLVLLLKTTASTREEESYYSQMGDRNDGVVVVAQCLSAVCSFGDTWLRGQVAALPPHTFVMKNDTRRREALTGTEKGKQTRKSSRSVDS